jgi:hypothetical protein
MLQDLCAAINGESIAAGITWSACIGSNGRAGSPHIQHTLALSLTALALAA